MFKNILFLIIGIILGSLIFVLLIKYNPNIFKPQSANISDCGEESLVKYCSGTNRCTTLCNLCSCKTPVCSLDDLCQ